MLTLEQQLIAIIQKRADMDRQAWGRTYDRFSSASTDEQRQVVLHEMAVCQARVEALESALDEMRVLVEQAGKEVTK